MPNNLSLIVDYYLELTDQIPTNYIRHLRAAKDLLELCDNNIEQAYELLDKTKDWVNGFGGDIWTIETCIKYYVNNLTKNAT